jgi:hypothetical protein
VISSLTAFSQKDTTIPTKSFPIPVVKLIVKDLLSGDSAKAQLELVNKELEKTRQIVVLKDSVISNLNTKIEYDGYILGLQKDKFKLLENHNGKVEKQLKIEKIKSRLFGSLTTIGLLVIGAFIITK